VHTVKVGLPGDPSNGQPPEMPVPPNLNYEFWLGPAPLAPYTEERVHPQADYSRPGWLRVYDYCHGMITGWGTHHNDIAQWALGTEMTGPVEIDGHAVFPKDSLWDVHSDDYRIEYTYADGRKLITAGQKYNRAGVTLVGSDAEIWVDRGKLESTKPEILKEKIGPNEIHLYESNDHKRNFIDCVRSRKEPVAPVEIGHRSCTVCLLGSHSMKLGRKLRWNPEKEEILDDAEASKMLARQMRTPWSLEG
jgi:hypothetical protein